VREPSSLKRLYPDHVAIERLLTPHRALVLYLAHVDPQTGEARARAFAGTTEVSEDPATGSAAGPLCAHVAARLGLERLELSQGAEIGRPSHLSTAIEGDRVRVGGDVVVVVDGDVVLDT
jgi:trans-2,3-dihydro-3-hydroxyanthranilate isomerase